MEILDIVEHKGEFFFAVLFLIGCSFLLLIWLIHEIKDWLKYRGGYNAYGFLFFTLIGAIFSIYMTVSIYKIGPDIEYKALVTDFNEVYKNGYTVVDQEGEIYILEKMKK